MLSEKKHIFQIRCARIHFTKTNRSSRNIASGGCTLKLNFTLVCNENFTVMCTFTERASQLSSLHSCFILGEQENFLVKFSARMIPATFCYLQFLQTNAQAIAMASIHVHITPSLHPYIQHCVTYVVLITN
jgi:hypothetical protein